MNRPKAFGSFVKRGNRVYRTSAYLQWGDTDNSIGACLLLNPGSATLKPELADKLNKDGHANGLLKAEDPTMEQLICFIKEIYADVPISGRLYIYNLFNLQNPSSSNAIDEFERLVRLGDYKIEDTFPSTSELKLHPWLLIGWGVKHEARWKNLRQIKDRWINIINDIELKVIGVKHKSNDEYYHPCPRIPTQRPVRQNELINSYNNNVGYKTIVTKQKRYTFLNGMVNMVMMRFL